MILDNHGRTVVSSGDSDRAEYGISSADTAHLMTILRDTLYSDKILAVLREYASNAWDAHKDAGKPDLPIKITMPTMANPTLEIRDFGHGMSHEQVFQIFTQYGASTKRASNEVVGYIGIGSKSAFAYSDSFNIISRNGGHCRSYVAVLDASERGEIRLLDDQPCADDDTGLTIQIAVQQQDIGLFNEKAAYLFQFFNPQPEINIKLPKPVINDLGVVLSDSNQVHSPTNWLAVMGCIPYPVSLHDLHLPYYVSNIHGVLYFKIGELRVSASRESLKYDDATTQLLKDRILAVIDEHVRKALQGIEAETPWKKRIMMHSLSLFSSLLPRMDADYQRREISIRNNHAPKLKFKFNRIYVRSDVRIVFRDDRRSIEGFGLNDNDLVVRPGSETTVAEAEKELNAMIDELKIQGIPVVRSSQLPWEKKRVKHIANPKHYRKAFEFKGNNSRSFYSPHSNYWEPVERDQQSDDDVYVILENFKVRGFDFYNVYRRDMQLLAAFDMMPKIYGYKYDPNKSNIYRGTEYSVWRDGITDRVMKAHPEINEILEAMEYAEILSEHIIMRGQEDISKVIDALGPTHKITLLIQKIFRAHAMLESLSDVKKDAVREIYRRMDVHDKARKEVEALLSSYPLVKAYELRAILGQHSSEWIMYIMTQDAFHRLNTKEEN